MPQVQVIEPLKALFQDAPPKKRVCAYARVSSDSADQLGSFAVQVEHFKARIAQNADWELVDIYADEAVSGTRTDKREEFRRLMADCRRGKIDLILVKSVSRFARNIHDCLSAVRELKALGVEAEFEEDGLKTADLPDELVIGAFSAIAQEEAVAISSNMRWSYTRRMQNGSFTCCTAPFGYNLAAGVLEENEREAPVVRRIFASYLCGKSMAQIAAALNAEHIPSKSGAADWQTSTVAYILKSERYIGDALLQKSYTTDTLPFRTVKNHGERDQYYVTGSHKPLITRAEFEQAQRLMKARTSPGVLLPRDKQYAFSRKITCGKCGALFKRKGTNGKVYWICYSHFGDKDRCEIRQIPEDAIQQAFLRLYDKLRRNCRLILGPALEQLAELKSKSTRSNEKVGFLSKEIAELDRQSLVLNRLRVKGYVDPATFLQKHNEICRRLDERKCSRRRQLEQDAEDEALRESRLLLGMLEQAAPGLPAFDEDLFGSIVQRIVVTEQNRLQFCLLGGFAFTETLPKEVFGR